MKLCAFLFVQELFSGIVLVDLNLLLILVVQGPSYGRLLWFTIQMPSGCILLRQVIDNGKAFCFKGPVLGTWYKL